jgi:TetR/AcrR family transcriptional regulator, fatty acid biosynthesis regulator
VERIGLMSGVRAEQKLKTRRDIIEAALNLLSADRSYSSLSLREVTREAGIAATSFYHHFKDMEELGLTLVDEGGLTLRQLMRQARKRLKKSTSVIRTSVETFMEFVENNPSVFRLLLRERSGTSLGFRKAIAREIRHFVEELADYLTYEGSYREDDVLVLADAMVMLVFNAGAERLDANTSQSKELLEMVISQLQFLAFGAKHLAEHRETK